MYNEKQNSEKGFAPYTRPEVRIELDKQLRFDEHGELKQVVDNEIVKHGKTDYRKIIKIFAILALICFGLDMIRLFFAFTPSKWEHELWRPIVIHNLIKISTPDIAENTVISKFRNADSSFDDMSRVAEQFKQYETTNVKYDLLFKTEEQVEKLLGEANPHNYTLPAMPASGQDGASEDDKYVAYYAFGDEGEATWVIVNYFKGYAVYVYRFS